MPGSRVALVLPLVALAACVSFRDMRAKNAYLKGDLDTAEQLTASSLESDPQDLQAKRLGARIATKRGADALDRGDVKTAKTYFEKAVQLYPADDVAEKYLDMIHREEAAGTVP